LTTYATFESKCVPLAGGIAEKREIVTMRRSVSRTETSLVVASTVQESKLFCCRYISQPDTGGLALLHYSEIILQICKFYRSSRL